MPFSFPETGTAVRVVTTDDEPWWVAADVASILGYSAASAMTRTLADDEKGVQTLHTPGGEQQFTVINEPGLYSAIIRSRVEGAQRFKRWVTHDVLPSIRRTGRYEAAPPSPRELAALVLAEADRADAAEARVAVLEPKAAAHDTYLSAGSGDRLVREVAKLLGWRQQDLRQFLIAERLIFARTADCGTTQWDFYASHGRHFRSAEHVVEHRTTGLCSHYTLHVRPAGVDLIQRRIAKRQAEPRNVLQGGAR
ncbi:phage antirepressor [Kitasatospora sp. NPDC059571]|uniref:phage antirepressor n=1 Tax=Kitasatospora sp. NPDC059571 TaxID=3346871 RepID=UPI0036A8D37F